MSIGGDEMDSIYNEKNNTMKREIQGGGYFELEFPELGDEKGKLVVLEGNRNLPFLIKRVFYIYGSRAGVIRGAHANKQSAFVLINVSGTSKIRIDNGTDSHIFSLNRPNMGIYISKMVWKDMYDFSKDSVLLVLSDQYYDASEYIRDYEEYKRAKAML